MKKYIIPLIALTARTGWGCEEEMVGGDWDYKDAMILVGQELIYAHNHTVELPAQQCSIDLQIVSEGISGQSSIDADHFGQNLPDAFSLTLLTPRHEAEIYDYIVDSWGVEHKEWPRYMQTIRITATENRFIIPRIMRCRLWTESPQVGAADITIRQAGAK